MGIVADSKIIVVHPESVTATAPSNKGLCHPGRALLEEPNSWLSTPIANGGHMQLYDSGLRYLPGGVSPRLSWTLEIAIFNPASDSCISQQLDLPTPLPGVAVSFDPSHTPPALMSPAPSQP